MTLKLWADQATPISLADRLLIILPQATESYSALAVTGHEGTADKGQNSS